MRICPVCRVLAARLQPALTRSCQSSGAPGGSYQAASLSALGRQIVIRLPVRRRVLAPITEQGLGIPRGGNVLGVRVRVRAVAELRDVAAGRADPLAEVARLQKGFHEGQPDKPIARQAAALCRKAGADLDAIPAWAAAGRRLRAVYFGHLPGSLKPGVDDGFVLRARDHAAYRAAPVPREAADATAPLVTKQLTACAGRQGSPGGDTGQPASMLARRSLPRRAGGVRPATASGLSPRWWDAFYVWLFLHLEEGRLHGCEPGH